MSIIRRGKNPFKPRARLLVLLGEQLITNEVIAVVELVKNAYDADATKVKVGLEKITDEGKGQITVSDDGCGMTLDTILNVWLEPATDFRKKQKEKKETTKKFKRFLLGEKGIGRFAAHKLGDMVEIITKAKTSNEEIYVIVEWHKFEKDEYLDKIPVNWVVRAPEVFRDGGHGTIINISKLRKPWNYRAIRNLFLKLTALNSPLLDKTNFEVILDAPEFKEKLTSLPQLVEVIEKSVYSLKGMVDANGILHYNYKFFNPAFAEMKRELINSVNDVREPKKFEGGRKPFCRQFTVEFHVWDLDPATLGETIQKAYYTNYVKPHTGIRIYRDGFRVWPYGEENDDSFSLDARRVNNPTVRLSRNQIIGMIEITFSENPELRDKTDREGLISNKEYEDFKELVIGCLAVLETERRKDKDKIDSLREKKKPADSVHMAINNLESKMDKKGHLEIYKGDVKSISSAYEQRVKEILEPLYVSAGLGIAYTIPVHEIIRNVKDLEKITNALIEDLKRKSGEDDTVTRLETILHTTDLVDDLVRGVGKLTRKGRPEIISLGSVVKDAMDITKSRLAKDDIDLEFIGDGKIKVKGFRNMLVTALLNLIDNSSYWLLHRGKDRKIVIKADRDPTSNPRLIVSDNGSGIKDDPAFLVQPFFTRKPDGSGLGLYIVDRIMEAHGGKIEFSKQEDEESFLEGANVSLIFTKIKEVR